jgi:alkylation response protein AidB-like acyl-CoA dehydrogenase
MTDESRTTRGRGEVTNNTAQEAAGSFGELLNAAFDEGMLGLLKDAEKRGRFPRELIETLGRTGVFAALWSGGARTDVGKLVELSERLGRLGSASASVGVSLHDSAIAMLRRFGRNEYLRYIADQAILGNKVVCLGASEVGGGSDLQAVTSIAEPTETGYRLRGAKKFVSLSTIADVIVVVVRVPESGHAEGNVALFALEADQVQVGDPYEKLGASYLDTAPIDFDVEVSAEAMLAWPGTGLAVLSWGLAHERLSVAGQVLGACDLAIGVTVAEMMRRKQFGSLLFEHQALRLRFADLQARVDMLRYALQGLVAQKTPPSVRVASGMKVTAARLGEEVISECLHIFGGTGYLTGPTPVERWWRDMKLARVGGGTDEVLWELVAAGMQPDYRAHDALVRA